ncbi:MAG: adenylate/guanylate cyclase domain-containing protein [Acidiferrobacterales bacterium]
MSNEHLQRKLAAIFYADVAGYSRLTGEDEEGTHRRLSAYLDTITTAIKHHRGKVLHFAGDAVLADFSSIVDALTCAAQIQRHLKARNEDLPEERKLQFRIGVNLGDVIVDRNEIYGDGVNVAARLESLAQPGGICVSGTVYDAIGTKLPFAYEFIGEQSVKNITRPVRAFHVQIDAHAADARKKLRSRLQQWRPMVLIVMATLLIVVGVAALWQFHLRATPDVIERVSEGASLELPAKPSIAVLPFQNMSGDPEQEYFSDGMTEDLITDLSKLSGLFVISRNSVFTYKGIPVKIRDVGRELGVRYVLEGSVRKAGDKVRITAQLIDSTNGFHVWADRFDGNLTDVFALQDEVAAKIVSALEIRLTETERQSLVRQYTDSLEAYDYLLRGLEQFSRLTRESNLSARGFYEKAVERDSEFARAYANLARTYAREFVDGWSDTPERSLQQAHELAQRAVALDDSLPQVHWVLGEVHLFSKHHAEAIEEVEKAIALDANHADAYGLLALTLHYAGTPKDSVALMEKAMRLNPRYPLDYLYVLGEIYFTLGRYDKAIDAFERALERNPVAQRPRMWLAASYAHAGRIDDAEWEVEQLVTLAPDFSLRRMQQVIPYKDPAHLEKLLNGLRKAGLHG